MRTLRKRTKEKGRSVMLRVGTVYVGSMTGKGRVSELADIPERERLLCNGRRVS